MPKNIKDIKVLGKTDKLIILVDKKTSDSHCVQMTDVVAKFIKKNDRFLFIKGLQVFIMKYGTEISLVHALNKEIEKGGE